jgi:hypothetical protein
MSTQLQSDTHSVSTVPAKRDFPKINAFYDALELIAERTEGLVWKAKKLIFGTAFLLFLIYELALFGKHLLNIWTHS